LQIIVKLSKNYLKILNYYIKDYDDNNGYNNKHIKKSFTLNFLKE